MSKGFGLEDMADDYNLILDKVNTCVMALELIKKLCDDPGPEIGYTCKKIAEEALKELSI